MRRIKIDRQLEVKVNTFCDELFKKRTFIKPIPTLNSLLAKAKGHRNNVKRQRQYIQHIISNYDRILKVKPSEFAALIKEFDQIIPHRLISKEFHERITAALRYNDLRDREYLNFIKEIGINACVYCNTQLTVVIDLKKLKSGPRKGESERKGNLELDHFYSQSKFPFLATSFFNLIPCCSNCNKSKSDDPSLFCLYTEKDDLDTFIFSIDDDSLDNYRNSKELKDLVIKFESVDKNSSLLENHKKLFRIDEIYATQKDIAVELIHKSDAYTNAYKQNLVDTFGGLFPDKAIINRLLVGNYDKPEDIHKRPMAKLQQDIARQLGLIK